MTEKAKPKLSEEELNKIARKARYDRAIKLWDLIQILGADKTCNDILPELWDIFDLTSERNNLVPQLKYERGTIDKDGNFRFEKGDWIGAWWWLLARLAGITEIEEFYFRNLPPIVYPLALYKKEKGGLRKVGIGEERNEGQFVKLDDIEALFDEIEKEYGLPKQLPSRLFVKRESKITEEKERHKPGCEKEQSALSPTINGPQYAFYKDGNMWKIIFDEKELPPLKQGGFKYFHYCMLYEKKAFSNLDLDIAVNPRPEPPEATIGREELKNEEIAIINAKAASRQEKADLATLRDIWERFGELQKDIAKAERDNDIVLKDQLEGQKDELLALINESKKPFRDDAQRTSNKVNQAMGRALKELRRYSGEVYNHFNQAFSPIHSTSKEYTPTKPLPWVLERNNKFF